MMALVTGGASSGKSAYAEQLACSLPGTRYYLAAMKPFGEEGARRIARHRALRAGKGFTTIECYEGLTTVSAPSAGSGESSGPSLGGPGEPSAPSAETGEPAGSSAEQETLLELSTGLGEPSGPLLDGPGEPSGPSTVQEEPSKPGSSGRASAAKAGDVRGCGSVALLESLGNVVANALFADDGTCATYDEALERVRRGVAHVATLFDNLVIVGDEVGGDGVRYDDATEAYRRLIGSAACEIAAGCDVVVECVAGQPLLVKGELCWA